MSEYRQTEYVVDFGDCRSNQFVRLNMALIEQNGAKLHERIVRCRDCINYEPNDYIHFTCEYLQCWAKPDDYCVWGERIEQ